MSILNSKDKITFLRSTFMNQYRNKQLPESFFNMFTDIISTDQLQTRHNDYNFQNIPAVKRTLEFFPMKCLIKTSLSIDVKSTADKIEYEDILKQELLSRYDTELQCDDIACCSCSQV